MERKVKPQTGERTKFFDRRLAGWQCKQVGAGLGCAEHGCCVAMCRGRATQRGQHHFRAECSAQCQQQLAPRPRLQLWDTLRHYDAKLNPDLDKRRQYGSTFGEGWLKALERDEQRRAAAAAHAS